MKADWRSRLEAEHEAGQGYKPNKADWLDGRWAGLKAAHDADDPRRGNTGVEPDVLREIGKKITAVPDGFHVHKPVQRFLDNRAKAIETGEGIDWATGEALAFCSLLKEGPPARRSCSTSSSPRASASGCAWRASSASCRTAMRGRDRSTPPRVSSASSR